MCASPCPTPIPCVQVVPYLVDLASDANPVIRSAANAGLDAVIDGDTEEDAWASRLRMLKFEAHNQVGRTACSGTAFSFDLARTAASYARLHCQHSPHSLASTPVANATGVDVHGAPPGWNA